MNNEELSAKAHEHFAKATKHLQNMKADIGDFWKEEKLNSREYRVACRYTALLAWRKGDIQTLAIAQIFLRYADNTFE